MSGGKVDVWVHERGNWLGILEPEAADNQLDVGGLQERETIVGVVALDCKAKDPVDLSFVRDLLSEISKASQSFCLISRIRLSDDTTIVKSST